VDGFEISFSGKEVAESTQLARELRKQLRSEGVPDTAMSIERQRSDTMDLGSSFHLSAEFFHNAAATTALAIHLGSIVHAVYEVCFRAHCGLKVKIANQVIEFGAGEIDLQKLRALLEEAANVAEPG